MKIAVATMDGTQISGHFGKSPYFTVFEIKDGKVNSFINRRNDFTRHFNAQRYAAFNEEDGKQHVHKQAAEELADCAVLIAGGMGRRAWNDLGKAGIDVYITEETAATVAVEKYLSGKLDNHSEKLH